MKLSEINPTPANLSDWSDVVALQEQLVTAVQEMSEMSTAVGMAKHVLEYDSDRRKRALSRAMSAALAGGDSCAKAEAEARASDNYSKELTVLANEHKAAETQLTKWDVAKLRWETARSLLSLQRETVKHL